MSLLKSSGISTSSAFKENIQGQVRNTSKLNISRSPSLSNLTAAGRLQDSSTSIQELKKKLSTSNLQTQSRLSSSNIDNSAVLRDLTNKLCSPSNFLGAKTSTTASNRLTKEISDKSLAFKSTLTESTLSRLDTSKDKIFIDDQASDLTNLSTNAHSLKHSRTTSINSGVSSNTGYYLGQSFGNTHLQKENEISRSLLANSQEQTSLLRTKFFTNDNCLLTNHPHHKTKAPLIDKSAKAGRNTSYGSILEDQRNELFQKKLSIATECTQKPHPLKNFLSPTSKTEFQTTFISPQTTLIKRSPRYSEQTDSCLDHSFSLTEELNRKRAEMQAKSSNKSTLRSTCKPSHFAGDGVVTAEDYIEDLFHISSDQLKNKFLTQDLRKRAFAELPSTGKIRELQHILTDATDEEVDQLPNNVTEALIKLSSIIVNRVKSSNYYKTKP